MIRMITKQDVDFDKQIEDKVINKTIVSNVVVTDVQVIDDIIDRKTYVAFDVRMIDHSETWLIETEYNQLPSIDDVINRLTKAIKEYEKDMIIGTLNKQSLIKKIGNVFSMLFGNKERSDVIRI